MTLIVVDGPLRLHLASALAAGMPVHRAYCRTNGIPVPVAELDRIQAALSGPEQPKLSVAAGDMQPVAMSYQQAARRLGVSERTVRRMVADGRLEAIHVGRRRLIRAADLAAYVDRLGGR